DALLHLVALVDVHAPQEEVVLAEPEAVLRVRELLVLRHQLDEVARLAIDRLLAHQRGGSLVVVPLLDAHEQLEVTIAQIGAEEVLVALRVAETARATRPRSPQPLLILLAARREVQEAGGLDVRSE